MDKKYVYAGIGILVLLVIIYFAVPKNTGNAITKINPIEESDSIMIPVSQVSADAQFLGYVSDDVVIEYFVVRADDGSIKTAFNACDVCYGAKKGYMQSGGDMICNNCGNHYPISGLGTKNLRGGGCWPGYLPSRIEGDYLVIKKSDLDAGKYRF